MLFTTIDFVVFFVFVLATLVVIKNRKFQHLFLLGASYFFFYYTSNYLVVLLIFSTILDFFIGKEIWKAETKERKKLLLLLSLSGNLGLLGFFKYTDFAVEQFIFLGSFLGETEGFSTLDIILPIGISFYTFQTISYTVEIYRGKLTPSKSFWEFALFVSFFPQLVAGPILRASHFLPQLREKIEKFETKEKLKQILLNQATLKAGITLMALGFFKKMFIADNIAPMVDEIFAAPVGLESLTIILGALAFGIQIYGDFSGYTDIAIGAAIILGFKIPINFNKPYFATSPSDFWRRWHISLSSWLRDYLYIPLGGNRKSGGRTYFNLLTVMFLGGLWHGASWNFVIWGVLHGVYLAAHKVILDKFPFLRNNWFFKTRAGHIVSIIITQYLVFLTWIAFRVNDFENMIYSMYKYVIFDFQIINTISFIGEHKFEVGLIGLFVILHFISYKKQNIPESITNLKLPYWILFLVVVMLSIFLFYEGNPEDFIYFQF